MTTKQTGQWMRYLGAAALTMAMLPGTLAAQTGSGRLMPGGGTYAQANGVIGVVQNVNRDLNYVTVRDQATGRDVKIDVRNMDTRQSINVWQLRPGDRISVNGGWQNGDTFRADRVAFPTYDPTMSSTATNGVTNGLAGTVRKVNRNLKFITVRDQATNRDVKVDVRRLDTRESVNVWQLRTGDPIVVDGGWTNRNTFRANRINVSSSQYQPMTSGYGAANFVSGIVQDVNRDLNYITVRDEVTGQPVKIDVRKMDTRRSVNVWDLRSGDRISINGNWATNRDSFQADTVNF